MGSNQCQPLIKQSNLHRSNPLPQNASTLPNMEQEDKRADEDLLEPGLKCSAAQCQRYIFTLESVKQQLFNTRMNQAPPQSYGVYYRPRQLYKSLDHRGMWGLLLLTSAPPPQTLSAPFWRFCLASVPVKPTGLIRPRSSMEMPPRAVWDLGMLRSPFSSRAVPLKYPQQETAISHQHAKTAVTSLHQGDT